MIEWFETRMLIGLAVLLSSFPLYAVEQMGMLCNIEHTPGDIRIWGVNRYDLSTGERESVFGVGNNRKIQSVACNHDGSMILFTMQETPRGEYEVFALLHGSRTPVQVTDNNVDDLHITFDKQGQWASWQTELADGRQVIVINQFRPDGSFSNIKTLGSAYPFIQPSLSQNGKWLVFVQLRTNNFITLRYELSTGKYTQVHSTLRRKRAHHPSINDDGNLVGFSEGKNQNKYWLKNIKQHFRFPQVNDPDAIEHATLTGDGQHFVFSLNLTDGDRSVYFYSVDSATLTPVGSSLDAPHRFLGNYLSSSPYQPLNDTGITACMNPDDWWNPPLDCSVYHGQDQSVGRDVTFKYEFDGTAGFSLTKLDSQGNALPSDAASWSCVKDNVTGLLWQVKQAPNGVVGDQGTLDADDRFTWYDSDATTNAGNEGDNNPSSDTCNGYQAGQVDSYCNTLAYTERTNQLAYCGRDNWRVPSRTELVSLAHYGNDGVAIDTNYFKDLNNSAGAATYWTRDSNPFRPEGAWNVDFSDGNYFVKGKQQGHSVRLVSFGK